ncbi:hypothetical protein AFM11_30195 [Mycolicibacterium wolinskyi]|uniref:Biofilm regulator BssS n=1 Tax=Mycolicibacterium wolinskyi TaxID=59750 RepID=A0A132PDW9_9MYCO|nr:hypothetical protein AFM11_30195 [Mycolicibacterium wolinskyi]
MKTGTDAGPGGNDAAPSPAPGSGKPPISPPAETTPQSNPAGDTELSGEAAEVAKRLDEALAKNRTALNEADEQLIDALLKAQDSSAEGKAKLTELQQSIIDQVQKLGPTLDTPAGQEQLASFLQGKTDEIHEVLKSKGLDSASQGAVLDGLAARYEALSGENPGEQNAPGDGAGAPSGAGPAPGAPGGSAPTDAGAAAAPGLGEDPMLSGLASDPLMAGLGSMLGPGMGALGSLPGMLGGMMPFGGGGAMGGGGLPLGDIGSGIGSAIRDAKAAGADTADPLTDPPVGDKPEAPGGDKDDQDKPGEVKDPPVGEGAQPNPAGAQAATNPADPQAQTGQVTPAGTGQPAPDDLTVKVPGSETPVTADNPAVAQAGRAVVSGTPIEQAYRDAGLSLSPPGAPITTNAVSQSRLAFGDVGQFTDHRIMALGNDKVWANGKAVALEDVDFGPTFLGWERPQAQAAAQPVVTASATTSPPTQTPPPHK